jgi:hypothetical protein
MILSCLCATAHFVIDRFQAKQDETFVCVLVRLETCRRFHEFGTLKISNQENRSGERNKMMRTRRSQYTEEEKDIERTRLNKFQQESLEAIAQKFRKNHLKIETIVEECSQIDQKRDNTIHPDDLIDVIKSLLPSNTITRREFHYLLLGLDGQSGHNIAYKKLLDLFPSKKSTTGGGRGDEEEQEHWYGEDDIHLDEFADYDNEHGSIGEWLHRRACPAEIENYKTLIACLEMFERDSGMRISAHANGFDIPLGPDLRAKLKFYVR